MKEDLLHFVWRYSLYDKSNLKTDTGEMVEIIQPGTYNTDAGADFFNARIRIGDVLMAGNVEMHIHSADWYRHRHDKDAAYNNVILHVIYEGGEGKTTSVQNGLDIPVLRLKDHISPGLLDRYELLKSSHDRIPCEQMIGSLPAGLSWHAWWDRLVVERLQSKTLVVESMLEDSVHDWDQVTFQMMATYFGASVNKEPFALLAKSLPMSVIHKHRDRPIQIEALLFGQAGLLDADFDDDYPNELKREFNYLRKLHSLVPINGHSWKFFRIRPVNFPTVRIAQLAALMTQQVHLFSSILESKSLDDLRKMLEIYVNPYWLTHFQFDRPSKKGDASLGRMLTDVILINAIVPLLFSYGRYKDDDAICERALGILSGLPAENNAIIRLWEEMGIYAKTASDTQAMLQLKNQYCDNKKCLQCQIGHRILGPAFSLVRVSD